MHLCGQDPFNIGKSEMWVLKIKIATGPQCQLKESFPAGAPCLTLREMGSQGGHPLRRWRVPIQPVSPNGLSGAADLHCRGFPSFSGSSYPFPPGGGFILISGLTIVCYVTPPSLADTGFGILGKGNCFLGPRGSPLSRHTEPCVSVS